MPTQRASQVGNCGAAASSSLKVVEGRLRFKVWSAASAFSGPSHASARTASPAGRVAKFDDLLAKAHRPGLARGQIDRSNRHQGRQAKVVRCRNPARDDHFAALAGNRLDCLLDGGHSCAKPTPDGKKVIPATGPDRLASPGQTRQGLIHRGAITEMQQALGSYRFALR